MSDDTSNGGNGQNDRGGTPATGSTADKNTMDTTPRGLPRRFYEDVKVELAPGGGGYCVALDKKLVMTPGRSLLTLPNRAGADAVAREWVRQGEYIDPNTMPTTKLANTAIDRVAPRVNEVIDELVGYAASDAICYRAEAPQELVACQKAAWDPLVGWALEDLDAAMIVTEGVIHVDQPEPALSVIRERLVQYDHYHLAALYNMTTLTGSLIIALAVARNHISVEQAWAAAHVDEDWQINQWGADAEATAKRKRRWREMVTAADLLTLLST